MKSMKILAVAVGLATLAACGGNKEANNVDANASLETENVDAGLNSDVNASDLNAADLNAAADVNSANAVDANAAGNAASNNSL